jgi:hypothetical protein
MKFEITMFMLILSSLTMTRFLGEKFQDMVLGSILASSMTIAIAYCFDLHRLSPIIFGISFVGMTSKDILRGWYYYLSVPIFISIYYLLSLCIQNIGGLLGFSAFLTVLVLKYAYKIAKLPMKR